jgi:hypothetical protein
LPVEEPVVSASTAPLASDNAAIAPPYVPPGLEAALLRMQGKSPEQLAAKEKAAVETKTEREVLSSLLQSNQFDAAFKYAKDNNVQNLLIDPTELRTLRSPFSSEEMKSFFNAMPKDLMGEQSEEEVKFDPAAGLEASLQEQTAPSGLSALGIGGGYPQVQRAFVPLEQKKEDGLFEDIIKTVLAAGTLYAGASALPGLIGGGSAAGAGTAGAAGAGGAGAAGTTGGLTGALKSVAAIPAELGGAVAKAVGLPVTSAAGKAALGNAIITGGTTAAKGGDLEDVLKAALLSAGITYVSAPVIDSLKDAAKAVGSKFGIGTGAATTAAGQAATDALSDVALDELLKEVTVTAARPALSNLVGLGAAAIPTSTKVDLPEPKISTEPTPPKPEETLEEVVVTSQRPGLENLLGLGTVALPTTTPATTPQPSVLEPEPVVTDRGVPEEPVEKPLDEVTVTAQKPPLSDLLGLGTVTVPTTTPVEVKPPEYIKDVVLPEEDKLEEVVVTGQRPGLDSLLGLGTVKVPTTTPVETPKPDYIKDVVIPEEEPLEEVVVTGQRPPLSDLLGLGTVAVPTTTPVDIKKPDYIKDVVLPEEEPLEEVVVTGTRPPLSDSLGLGTVKVPTTTPVDLPKPEVIYDQIVYPEEVVVEGTKPTEGGLNLPPFSIPTTTPVDLPQPKINEPSTLKDLLDRFGTIENLIKLLGALGSAGAGGKGAAAPTAPTGGLGGALPKYIYNRQQLNPDIDYYTYGTRPEAKFFEYGTQLEKPIQPQLPPAKPPGEDVPMATGGLTGYAKGGSKSSRYVDGPGSGREDKIPALLSDGEYVIDAETLALLGDGSTKEGARRMDDFRANIRKHKGRALSRGRISPNAKSPSKYMGGGLT